MTLTRNLILLATFQMALGTIGFSQTPGDTTLTLDMQMRVRSEWRDGYKVAMDSETPGELVTVQRSRMALKGKWKSFDYKLGAQDIRTFGGPAGETQGTIGISEAWWSTEMTNGIVHPDVGGYPKCLKWSSQSRISLKSSTSPFGGC